MKKLVVTALLFNSVLCVQKVTAQYESIVQQGEFGISVGAAHYFGDLNTRAKLNRPKPALGVFFRKQFGNYTALRIAAHYARLGYSDVYNTQNDYQRRRNLSFNSNIFELDPARRFQLLQVHSCRSLLQFHSICNAGCRHYSATILLLTSMARNIFCVRWEPKDRAQTLIPIANHTIQWRLWCQLGLASNMPLTNA